ncbi:MAG: hypothetical protein M3N34_00355 [Pseudomonadota bacterium]|nr:hypothetical protein [Pseudomonadota bacterium]
MALAFDDNEVIYQRIGELCHAWDCCANILLNTMLNCTDGQLKGITNNIDPVSGRIRLIKNLITTLDQSEEWKSMAMAILNRIQDDIGPKRNRIVYDAWDLESDTTQQMDCLAQIGPVQSAPPSLIIELREEITVEHIEQVLHQTSICANGLLCISADIANWKGRGLTPLKSSLLPLLKQTERILSRLGLKPYSAELFAPSMESDSKLRFG